MSAPTGKGQRPPGPPTEEMPKLVVSPEFHAEHRCRLMPAHVRALQQVPQGWRLSGPRYLIAPIYFCCFCGRELVKEGA